MIHNQFILDVLQNTNIDMVGFADLREVAPEQRHGLPYGICIATALTVFPDMSEVPSQAYYDEYKRINKELKETSLYLEKCIIEQGFAAYSLSRNMQDENFVTVLPFKTLATRAGLGWIGKSSTLITKEYGNALRMNGVITNMPVKAGTPINASQCGDCTECITHCPAKAIVGNHWDLKTARNELVDPFACKAKVIERGQEMGVTEGSCGICISVCPWTKSYIRQLSE
ncbi:MAG: epoxyqueuosine reductase [Ruminococcaceae bacterium]|nr:epoxyqueuosine reductase [Oscillospiraceae bacterium]